MNKNTMTQIKNIFSLCLLTFSITALLVACDRKEENDSATLIFSIPKSVSSQADQPIGPANIGSDPGDLDGITRIIIKVLVGDSEVASGDILTSGGTLSLSVPPHTSFSITGEAFAGNELRFEDQTTVQALRPGEIAPVNLVLRPVGEVPSKSISGSVSTIGLPGSVEGASIQVLQVNSSGAILDILASGTVSDGSYSMEIPETINPSSSIIFRVSDSNDGFTMDARYTRVSVNVNPISHAVSNLVTEIASDLNAVTTDEIQQIERTMNLIALDLGPQETAIEDYARQLINLLKSDLETAHIASSSVTSSEICGLVQDSDNQTLAGITIVIRDFDTHTRRASTETKATVDDNGFNYCVNVPTSGETDVITGQVANGNYIVGAINHTNTSFAASEWWTSNGGAALRIEAGKLFFIESDTIAANFTLAPGARIEGSVTIAEDGPGDPLYGIKVLARSKVTQFLSAGATTDANGSYRINVLPGEYIIESRNSTSQPYASVTYNGPAGTHIRNFGSVINLVANQTSTASFELEPGNLLTGSVTELSPETEEETAVTGVRVSIDQANPGGNPTTGGAATRLRITNVDGSYNVWLRADLYNVFAYGQRASADLQQGSLAQPLAFSSPVAKLPVIVRHNGNTVSKVKARLFDLPDGPPGLKGSDFSKSDGSLTLYSNTNGSHVVVARVEGQEEYSSIVYDDQTILGSGTNVTLSPPNQFTPPVTVNLRDAGLLTGTVTRTNGNVVPNFKVTVYPQNAGDDYDRFVNTRTRGDGTFALSLPEGNYAAVTAADENCIGVPIIAGETTVISGTYILGDGGPCAITQLPPSATTLTGNVTSNDLDPPLLDGTLVSLVQLDNSGARVGTAATGTIQSGIYQINLESPLIPGSSFEIIVNGSNLSGFYTDTSNIDINPITTAANRLIKDFANYTGDAISANEILEIEKTLRQVEQEYDMSTAVETLNVYVDQLNINFLADLKTANILSSSFASGSICGQVRDTASTGLGGITMVAMDFNSRVRRARTTTDSNGNYCIDIPINGEIDPLNNPSSGGRYILGALNYTNTSMAASEWWTSGGGSQLRIDGGEISIVDVTPQTIDFTLAPGARIEGTVQTPAGEVPGQPLPSVRVVIRDKDTQFVAAAARSRVDGTYTVNVLPGDYIFEARNTTFRRYASETFGGGTNSNILNYGAIRTLVENTTFTANFELSSVAELLSGQVTDGVGGNAVTGIRVAINEAQQGERGAATRLRITKVDGSYQVWLKPDEYDVFTYGQSDNANLLQLPHRSTFEANVAELPIVVQHTSQRVSQAKVRLREDLGEVFPFVGSDSSKSDGSLTLYAAFSGNFKVNARVQGEHPFGSIGFDNKTQRYLGDAVTLTVGQTAAETVVNLPTAGILKGVITDFTGAAIPNVFVSVYLVGNLSDWDELVTTRSRSDGSFTLSLPEGVYNSISFSGTSTGNCNNVPIIAGATTTLEAEESEGTICRISVTTNNITFDLNTSADLSQHFLNIQPPANNSWPMIGYNGTTASYNYDYITPSTLNGIPTTELYDSGTIDYIGYALAYSTNGAIYALGRYFGDGGFESYMQQPRVYLPASLNVGDTWLTPEGDATNEVIAVGIDSPFGYTGTTHIRTPYTGGPTWDTYIRNSDGIVNELMDGGVESYRRSDLPIEPPIGIGVALPSL